MRRRLLLGGVGLAALTAAACQRRDAGVANATQPVVMPPASRRDGVIRQVFYTPAYVGAAHAFETTRKAGWVAESLRQSPIAGLALATHEALQEADVLTMHSPEYVTAVRTGVPRALAESQGFPWDPQLWSMVLASNGGVAAAARTALRDGVAGALASGLHHARREHGAGFCTFNGLALAVAAMRQARVARILIIDLDAHCGGGTHSLVGDEEGTRILDIAVDRFDVYEPAPHNTLDLVERADDYLPTLQHRLAERDDESFDLCLYNAGMDPHQDCPVGGLAGIDETVLAAREQLVFAWCRRKRLPVAFVLAGGYIGPRLDVERLVGLHRLTLTAAAL